MIHEGKLNGALNRSSCYPGFRSPRLPSSPGPLLPQLEAPEIDYQAPPFRLPRSLSVCRFCPLVCLPVLLSPVFHQDIPNFRRCILRARSPGFIRRSLSSHLLWAVSRRREQKAPQDEEGARSGMLTARHRFSLYKIFFRVSRDCFPSTAPIFFQRSRQGNTDCEFLIGIPFHLRTTPNIFKATS